MRTVLWRLERLCSLVRSLRKSDFVSLLALDSLYPSKESAMFCRIQRGHSMRTKVARRRLCLFACAALASSAALASAASTATWIAPVSGNWSDPTKWSTNPNFPNNGSPTSTDTYDVLINPTGSAYTILLSTPAISLDSLTLNSADATLRQTGQLTVPVLTLDAGKLLLDGGAVITNATITGPAGTFLITSQNANTLQNVTVNAGISVASGSLSLDSSTQLAGGTISLAGTTISPVSLRTGNLSGTGEVVFNGNSSNAILPPTGNSLTIGPNIIVRTGSGGGGVGSVGAPLINHGLISAQTPGAAITLQGSSVTNQGTLQASNRGILGIFNLSAPLGNLLLNNGTLSLSGASTIVDPLTITTGNALTLSGTWTNSGGINIAGGQINFATIPSATGSITQSNATIGVVGPLSTSQLEQVSYTDYSRIEIASPAVLNNGGKTLHLPANVASSFTGGTISGGTIDGAAGASLAVSGLGILDGVTLNANSSGTLHFRNGITLNGIHRGGVSVFPTNAGNESISGSGQIILNGSNLNNAINHTLTIGPSINVLNETGHASIGFGGVNNVTNQGHVIVSGWSITFENPIINSGTVETTGSGFIFNNAQFTNNGVVNIGSQFWQAGAPFTSSGTIGGAGTLEVDAPTVIGGKQNWLPGSLIDLEMSTVALNSNAGTPASATAAVSANLQIFAQNYVDDGGFTLGADQDLRSVRIDAGNQGNQSLDLNSPTTPGAFRSMRVYDSDVAGARNGLYYAIINANGPGSTSPTDGIFDSNLSAHPNSRIGMARVLDLHGDEHFLIRPTRIGDLNLDGAVTIADFITLSSNFGRTDAIWGEGDLNYDRAVTIADFVELAENFNTTYSGQSFSISESDATALANFYSAHVPEPAFLVLCAASCSQLLSRRFRPPKA